MGGLSRTSSSSAQGNEHRSAAGAESSISNGNKDHPNNLAGAKSKHQKDSAQKVVNAMSKRCGRLMKSLGCVQAIEGSPWLCLHIGSIINEMVEKDANGQVILSAEHATGPTFNIEDLINSLQLFSDLLMRPGLLPIQSLREANASPYRGGVYQAIECIADWAKEIYTECDSLKSYMDTCTVGTTPKTLMSSTRKDDGAPSASASLASSSTAQASSCARASAKEVPGAASADLPSFSEMAAAGAAAGVAAAPANGEKKKPSSKDKEKDKQSQKAAASSSSSSEKEKTKDKKSKHHKENASAAENVDKDKKGKDHKENASAAENVNKDKKGKDKKGTDKKSKEDAADTSSDHLTNEERACMAIEEAKRIILSKTQENKQNAGTFQSELMKGLQEVAKEQKEKRSRKRVVESSKVSDDEDEEHELHVRGGRDAADEDMQVDGHNDDDDDVDDEVDEDDESNQRPHDEARKDKQATKKKKKQQQQQQQDKKSNDRSRKKARTEEIGGGHAEVVSSAETASQNKEVGVPGTSSHAATHTGEAREVVQMTPSGDVSFSRTLVGSSVGSGRGGSGGESGSISQPCAAAGKSPALSRADVKSMAFFGTKRLADTLLAASEAALLPAPPSQVLRAVSCLSLSPGGENQGNKEHEDDEDADVCEIVEEHQKQQHHHAHNNNNGSGGDDEGEREAKMRGGGKGEAQQRLSSIVMASMLQEQGQEQKQKEAAEREDEDEEDDFQGEDDEDDDEDERELFQTDCFANVSM